MAKGDRGEIGHNSYALNKAAKDELNSLVKKICNLLDERDGINDDIKDVYAQAKGEGYDTKALRKVVAEKRKGRDEDFEQVLDVYRAALGLI